MIVDGAVWGQVEAGNSVINELCRCCNRAGRSRCCCCVFGARESCERTWDAIWQLWIAFTIFFVVVVFTFDFTFANNEPAGAGPVSGPGTSSMESAWPASSIHSMHSIISLSLSHDDFVLFCFEFCYLGLAIFEASVYTYDCLSASMAGFHSSGEGQTAMFCCFSSCFFWLFDCCVINTEAGSFARCLISVLNCCPNDQVELREASLFFSGAGGGNWCHGHISLVATLVLSELVDWNVHSILGYCSILCLDYISPRSKEDESDWLRGLRYLRRFLIFCFCFCFFHFHFGLDSN